MFTHPFPHAFGLDINDLSIKVVSLRNASLLRRRPVYELVAARSVDLPYGLIVDGEIMQPELVRKYIQHLLYGKTPRKEQVASPWTVVSLPEKKSFLKLITLPKPADDIIEEDIVITAKQHVPFEEESYYLDWQIIPQEERRNADETTVLIAVTDKNIANSYTYLIESIGLGVVALEIEALATARAMITAEKMYEGEARALLDIGASKTTLVIYDNNSIQFSTVLPYSGEIVTTTLTQKLHLSHQEAERIKKDHGLSLEHKKNAAWVLLMESTEQLAKDIEKAIRFYYSHFSNANKVTHITMSGGGSLMKKLDEILSAQLHIEAAPGHPWKNLSSKSPRPVQYPDGLRYTCAIGLALRAADNPFTTHDTI